jgi:hypothetical protein
VTEGTEENPHWVGYDKMVIPSKDQTYMLQIVAGQPGHPLASQIALCLDSKPLHRSGYITKPFAHPDSELLQLTQSRANKVLGEIIVVHEFKMKEDGNLCLI